MDISSLLERPGGSRNGDSAPSSTSRSTVVDPIRPEQREPQNMPPGQSLPLPPPGPPNAQYQQSYPPPYQHPHHYQPPYGHAPMPSYGGPPQAMAPLPPMQPGQDMRMQHGPPPPGAMINYAQAKRLASGAHPAESPAKKKQSKWSADEDAAIIELRGNGMKWEDISRNLPGRSAISCRLRFQNYLERRSEWDEEKKNKLARLYERFKKDMWEKISKEMALPWRAAEAMHWQIGEVEMASRANVPVFHLAGYSPSQPSQGAYTGSGSTPTHISGSERRSDGSASPRSASEYQQGAMIDLASREAQLRAATRAGQRRSSDQSSANEQEDGHHRRSPRPLTGHDNMINPSLGEREGSTVPKPYLSPFVKEDAGVIDGRRSPN